MNSYELVVIVKDSEPVVNETVKEIQEILASKEIKVVNQNNWGSRKLAYQINKENNGYYIIFNISGDGENVKSIEKNLTIKENILRFRIFKDEPKKIKEKKNE
ncbi:MAG: 30S ribosomal protein S6 [bacterium]|nr:30S ribosomal protein S6 [bacterium]